MKIKNYHLNNYPDNSDEDLRLNVWKRTRALKQLSTFLAKQKLTKRVIRTQTRRPTSLFNSNSNSNSNSKQLHSEAIAVADLTATTGSNNNSSAVDANGSGAVAELSSKLAALPQNLLSNPVVAKATKGIFSHTLLVGLTLLSGAGGDSLLMLDAIKRYVFMHQIEMPIINGLVDFFFDKTVGI